jgi:hypothetical protein
VLVERRHVYRIEGVHAVGFCDFMWVGGASGGVQAHGIYE